MWASECFLCFVMLFFPSSPSPCWLVLKSLMTSTMGTPWGISLDAPPPTPESVRTFARSVGRSYADVITKFCQLDGLPIFLTHGASLARFARWSSAMNTVTITLSSWVLVVDRAPAWCSGGHGFDSCRGLRIFLCPALVSCRVIHILLPNLNFIVFINLSLVLWIFPILLCVSTRRETNTLELKESFWAIQGDSLQTLHTVRSYSAKVCNFENNPYLSNVSASLCDIGWTGILGSGISSKDSLYIPPFKCIRSSLISWKKYV